MILQPGDIGIDYSFSRPPAAAIAAAGVRVVVRYISSARTNPKNITAAERDSLLAAGLGLLLVWEQGAADPAQGAVLGATHGLAAGDFARALAYPVALPVIAAVDFGVTLTQMPAVLHYLAAFRQASGGYPLGVYGNDRVVTAATEAGLSVLGWQTRAWSQGRRSPYTDCRQEIGFVHPTVAALSAAHGAVDDNTVLRPFEAWSLTPPTAAGADQGEPMHVIDGTTGEFWRIATDASGALYARPLRECPRGGDWNNFGPINDLVNGPLTTVPHSLLQAMYDVQGAPSAPPVPPPGLRDHVHANVNQPPTTGGVTP